jgi:hypothetical protein|tara:strand:+ start:717 stop:908 length:192 start_codon:yes stop_codon:yes gene_type:complete
MRITPINSMIPIQDALKDKEQREEQLINKVKDVLAMYKDTQTNLASKASRDEIATNIVKNVYL